MVRTVRGVGGATERDGDRLLPGSLRRSAVVLSAACVVALTVLAVRYHGGDRPGAFDEWAYVGLTNLRLPRGPLTGVVDAVPPVFVGLVAVLTVALVARRRWRRAALATLGPGLALLVTEVGKRLVGRSLDGGLALPSGHTTGVASVVTMIAVLRISRATHVRRAALLGLLAVTLAAEAIGFLMVTLHFHYATDIVAGYCVALAMPLAVALAIDGVPHRDRRETEGSPDYRRHWRDREGRPRLARGRPQPGNHRR
jgi:membrane-associated phospholipid phosphatase